VVLTPDQRESGHSVDDLSGLIRAVADYGEQARLLALNLAVAAPKMKSSGFNRRKLDDDLFAMVTRMSTVARQVAEIANAAEKGFNPQNFTDSDRLLRLLLEKGVFNPDVVSHLERSLQEALALVQQIADHVGAQSPCSPRSEPS
jgi:uncharacterized membrane protein YccC